MSQPTACTPETVEQSVFQSVMNLFQRGDEQRERTRGQLKRPDSAVLPPLSQQCREDDCWCAAAANSRHFRPEEAGILPAGRTQGTSSHATGEWEPERVWPEVAGEWELIEEGGRAGVSAAFDAYHD
eukprot:2580396-Prymnesium_polylepis.2